MIHKNQAGLNRLNQLLDMLLVFGSYVFSSWFWLNFLERDRENMAAIGPKTLWLSAAYSFFLLLALLISGFYNTTRTRSILWKLRTLFFTITIALLFVSAMLFVFRLEDFSRGVLLLFYGITLFGLSGKYILMRLLFRHLRSIGLNIKHEIVVGTGSLALQYAEDVEKEKGLGIRIHGFVGEQKEQASPWLGSFEKLDQILSATDIDEAVLALNPEEYTHIRGMIAACEKNGVVYHVIPFYNDIIPANPTIETIGRSKLINMRVNRLQNPIWEGVKRAFDLMVSSLGLLILSPLFAFLAIGVRLSSPGPVLFKQTRVGFNRHEFQMLKFRSMRVNTEENTAWSTESDPRRTKFGSFIRKTSLDELPQLLNVLKGDMSLVGPRPELPHFVEQFRETIPYYMVKHQVPAGMTGWAQIHGYRGDTSIEKRVELDLWYIDHWSPWLDLNILFRTFFGGMLNAESLSQEKEKSRTRGKRKQ